MASKSMVIYGCKVFCVIFMMAMMYDLIFGDFGDPPFSFTGISFDKEFEKKSTVKHNSSGQNFDLIINSYMRSGSTFLGRIFSIRPDTFYVFEPLWNAQQFAFYMGRRDVCHYHENRCARQGSDAVANEIGTGITLPESMAFLNGLLDCTFRDYERFLPDPRRFPREFPDEKHSWNFAKGTLWDPYLDCANLKHSTYKQCFSLMKPVCEGAKHKVMKVLRTSLSNLEALLKSRKNLKVIHLFRDPRGIINSHLNTRFYQQRVQTELEIENDIKTTCNRMRYDIKTSLRLRKLYTDQFQIVQYENFGDLTRGAHALYDFMEMGSTPEIDKNLEKLARPENLTKGFHPYSYRTSLPWNIERIADKHCRRVFQALGYPVFKNIDAYANSEISNNLPYTLD